MNVLVVDDDDRFRGQLSAALTQAGCSVRQARNGNEAIDTYLSYKGLEVIVTDLFMPVMDGIELIEYFDGHPRVRVIALSSVSPEGFRLDAAARAVGAYAVVDKDDPEAMEGLASLIQAAKL